MPDLGLLVLTMVLAALAAGFIVLPLARPAPGDAPRSEPGADLEALAVRHRIAVESLRDVEADHRAGIQDEAGYLAQRAEAEERAALTLAALEAARERQEAGAAGPRATTPTTGRDPRGSIRVLAIVAGALVLLLMAGTLLPAPLSLANGTVVDQQLAAAQAAEQQRLAEIDRLRGLLASNPRDAASLVELANLYLSGGSATDRTTAAQLLLFAIQLEPKNADAYRLLITAYISAGDYPDATAATDAFAKVVPGSADVSFFRGLIALQGSGDRAAAVRWFDAFLAAAPDDPRAAMVRSLRAEAAGELPGASRVPGPSPSPGG